MKRMVPEALAAVDWVQRDSTFLKVLDGIAFLAAALYGAVWLAEKRRMARPRRLRAAGWQALTLLSFAVFLAVRVVVIHQ
jgi:hypothetical protein